MALFKQSRTPTAISHRQRLHESLARHGLIGKDDPRGPSRTSGVKGSALRSVLQEWGDVGCLFGLYISSRIDLFSAEECDELSHIPDRATASSFTEVQQFVERELGVGIHQAFLAVEPTPYDTSLLRDSYVAMLESGQNVTLHVLRSDFRSLPTDQLDALRMLGETSFLGWSSRLTTDVVDDFVRELQLRVDFLQEAEALDTLARDVQAEVELYSPRVIWEFCRPGVLAVERQPWGSLSRIAARRKDSGDGRAFPGALDRSSERLANLICLAWLRQVFLGRVFPVQFGFDDVFVLEEDGRLGLMGRSYAIPTPEARADLWRYLLAVAADDPDECCRTLLALTYRHEASGPPDELLAAFRQAINCFTSGPGEKDFYTGLAARILRQLQLATQLGYRPLPSLLIFYRGIFCAAALSRALHPSSDSLQDAVDGVWSLTIFTSVHQMMRADALREMGGKYLTAMLEFPMSLDAMLSQNAKNNGASPFETTPASVGQQAPPNTVAIVLLLTALLWLARSGIIQISSRSAGALTFLVACVIGLLVLRMAARS
jgi:predicted unusual protein kinase regulating ubiquinone biosynthesis (AarF/ABC1/UbiB family)